MGSLLRRLAALVLCLLGSTAVADAICEAAHELRSLSTTRFELPSGTSRSRLEIKGQLLRRRLIENDDWFWVGYELYGAELTLNGERTVVRAYGVPFAAQFERDTGRVLRMRYAAELEPSDEAKLMGIQRTLHVSPPPEGADPERYARREQDDLGVYLATYEQDEARATTRSRVAYDTLVGGRGPGALSPETVIIHGDRFSFQSDACGFGDGEGRSDIEIITGAGAVRLRTLQTLDLVASRRPIPSAAQLPRLPADPALWPLAPRETIYATEPRRPLASAEAFIAALGKLAEAGLDPDDLEALLYDNNRYLDSLVGPLSEHSWSDDFEQTLFLAIGQADTPSAHGLLTAIATAVDLDDRSRFRALMGLRYARTTLDPVLVETMMMEARNTAAGGEDRELADSAMLVLGIIARTQGDANLSSALAGGLVDATEAQEAALLGALGNAGDPRQIPVIDAYLDVSNARLRTRAAQALGMISDESAVSALTTHLAKERDEGVRAVMLRALGQHPLDESARSALLAAAGPGESRTVRNAALRAYARQRHHAPEVSTELRAMLTRANDRDSLEIIMGALYGTP